MQTISRLPRHRRGRHFKRRSVGHVHLGIYIAHEDVPLLPGVRVIAVASPALEGGIALQRNGSP